MNRVFLVRHGVTAWNHDGRYQGQLDVPLSAKGRLQAAAARERLRDESFTACYTSTLARARVTAEIILEEHFCPLLQLPELNEMHYGAWEGLLRAEIMERFAEDWARHKQDPLQYPPTDGESRADLRRRVERALAQIARDQHDATALVVAHGGTIRAMVGLALGLPMQEWRKLRLDNASLSIVELYDDGGVLSLFNDTAHLGPRKEAPEREPAH
jgi:alpha-ribazole phosphatase/probable phosphoglycerate mutase